MIDPFSINTLTDKPFSWKKNFIEKIQFVPEYLLILDAIS